jgi:iron complex outermembrane recepter protein
MAIISRSARAHKALDAKPPFNPANHAAVNYNPTYSYRGILERLFRVGAKLSF